eukprot:365247-Chlamydomonas_euryale.AAC.11
MVIMGCTHPCIVCSANRLPTVPVLCRLLTSHADEHVDAISALAGDDATEVEGVEDKQGPDGFRKYDEDVVSGVSEKTRAEIASYKLTKTELANLVPEVRMCWKGGRVRQRAHGVPCIRGCCMRQRASHVKPVCWL